jgi:elongation factor Ts
MEVSAAVVKQLREKTGAGMMDCKKALQQADGDMDRATAILREQGLLVARKRAGRAAAQGTVATYVHGGKLGVMVEVNAETDFVANTDEFRQFARECAMQIAAMKPDYIAPEDVPQAVLEQEREIYRNQARGEGKPENVLDRIVEGKLKKFYSQACLLEQVYIRDDKLTVRDLLNELSGKVGERIVVRRFVAYRVGEESETPEPEACDVVLVTRGQ